MREDNNWGHTIDSDDPNQGYVDDSSKINEVINQRLDGRGKTGHLVNEAVLQENKGGQDERINTNYGGYTVDNNDPIQGYVNDPSKVQDYFKSLEDALPGDLQETVATNDTEVATINEEEPEKIESKAEKADASHEFQFSGAEKARKDEKLAKVFEKGIGIRDRYKDPGNPRYRLLSVAAVEMETIDQTGEAVDKVKSINKAVEKAAKIAVGEEEMDDYSSDTVAGVQAYIVEDLIGNDANQVSIGTTETIVNSNGQVGKDPEIYKNLVVVRWIKNSINHVFVFSPRKDAAMYALVDDSMGDSWKKTFLMAGAVNGDERREIMSVNHDQSGDGYLHEKTLEKLIDRMMQRKELVVAMEADEMSLEDKAKIHSSISEEYARLAHLTPGQPLKTTLPSETRSEKAATKNRIRNAQNEDIA